MTLRRFRGMTTANKVTIVRILLVPLFISQVVYYVNGGTEFHRVVALLCFALAAGSDAIDGYIARRYHQRSELGKILDPLADKLLLVSGIVMLSLHNEPYLTRLPLWLPTTIIGRDVLLLIGVIVIQMTCGKVAVQPRFTGKAATVFQMTVVAWGLLKWSPRWLEVWVWAAGVLTVVSGLLYVWDGVRQLSASPTSAPAAKQREEFKM